MFARVIEGVDQAGDDVWGADPTQCIDGRDSNVWVRVTDGGH